MTAGVAHNIRLFDSCVKRPAAGEKLWIMGARISAGYSPVETGLDAFVTYGKPVDFIGKAGREERESGGFACLYRRQKTLM